VRIRVGLIAMLLVSSIGTVSCAQACPTALISGVLVADGDALGLGSEEGDIRPVHWPDGYSVRSEGVDLVLVDVLGNIKAREGDRIEMAGSAADDGSAHGCGPVGVVPQEAP
jgi:hypothetical protein